MITEFLVLMIPYQLSRYRASHKKGRILSPTYIIYTYLQTAPSFRVQFTRQQGSWSKHNVWLSGCPQSHSSPFSITPFPHTAPDGTESVGGKTSKYILYRMWGRTDRLWSNPLSSLSFVRWSFCCSLRRRCCLLQLRTGTWCTCRQNTPQQGHASNRTMRQYSTYIKI